MDLPQVVKGPALTGDINRRGWRLALPQLLSALNDELHRRTAATATGLATLNRPLHALQRMLAQQLQHTHELPGARMRPLDRL